MNWKDWQQRLNRVGFPCKITGKLNPETKKQTIAFKKWVWPKYPKTWDSNVGLITKAKMQWCIVKGKAYKFVPKITTAQRILAHLRQELGNREEPIGSNSGTQIAKYFQGDSPGQAWCSYFATWILKSAGVPVPKLPAVSSLAGWFQTYGKYIGKVAPRTGDVCFFGLPAGTHVEIVEWSKGDVFGTIGGNTGDAVQRRSYDLINPKISGFGRP